MDRSALKWDLRAQLLKAELVAAAIAMKESRFCSNTIVELGFKEGFESVPVYIDNTSALHVVGNKTFSPREKHITLSYFFGQEIAKERNTTIHCVKTDHQLPDLWTNNLNKHRHRYLIKLINAPQGLCGRGTCVSMAHQ